MSDSPSTPGVPDRSGDIPQSSPSKKKTSAWVWVGVVVAVLVIGGLLLSLTSSSSGGSSWLFFWRKTTTVPLVVGQTESQAENIITAAGFRVGQISQVPTLGVAPGLVVEQSPAANTKARQDTAIDLSVSQIPQVKVPSVVGQTQSAASETLAEQGLRIGTVSYTYSSSVDAGDITAQDPASGTEVQQGAAINITVSKGQQQGQVPNVVGLSQNDAQSTLQGAGFKVTVTKASSTSVPAGDVISQSPAAGTVTAAGSTVTMTVSTGVPSAPMATVPNLVGMGVVDAFNALQKANLKMNIAFAASDQYVLKVAEQDPAAGKSVDQGTVVTVTIGMPSFTLAKPTPLPTEPGGGTGGSTTPTSGESTGGTGAQQQPSTPTTP